MPFGIIAAVVAGSAASTIAYVSSAYASHRTQVPLLSNCEYCGSQANIGQTNKQCRNCGAPLKRATSQETFDRPGPGRTSVRHRIHEPLHRVHASTAGTVSDGNGDVARMPRNDDYPISQGVCGESSAYGGGIEGGAGFSSSEYGTYCPPPEAIPQAQEMPSQIEITAPQATGAEMVSPDLSTPPDFPAAGY